MIDSALMMPCPPIPMIPSQSDGTITMGDLVLSDIELAGMYRECRERHGALAEWARQAVGAEN